MQYRTGQHYVIYTRCSTGQQRDKGYSHEYQIDGIRTAHIIQKNGWHEVGQFADTASGTSFDNRGEGLDAAYAFCKRNKSVKYLLVADYSEIKADIEAQEADALKQIAHAQLLNSDIEQTFLRASAFLTNICTIFAGASVEHKKKILRRFSQAVFRLKNQQTRLEPLKLIQSLAQYAHYQQIMNCWK